MLRVIYFIRSIRLRELRGQTSSSANGRWKVLENSVRDVFSSHTPTKYAATKCRELPRHIAGDRLHRAPHDAQLLHPAAQRAWLKIEQFCCAEVALDPPVRLREHGDDVLALDLFERRNTA